MLDCLIDPASVTSLSCPVGAASFVAGCFILFIFKIISASNGNIVGRRVGKFLLLVPVIITVMTCGMGGTACSELYSFFDSPDFLARIWCGHNPLLARRWRPLKSIWAYLLQHMQ